MPGSVFEHVSLMFHVHSNEHTCFVENGPLPCPLRSLLTQASGSGTAPKVEFNLVFDLLKSLSK